MKLLPEVKREWPLAANLVTTGLFLAFGTGWLADLSGAAWFAFISSWLLAAMFLSAFAVVRHAEALAVKLGEALRHADPHARRHRHRGDDDRRDHVRGQGHPRSPATR